MAASAAVAIQAGKIISTFDIDKPEVANMLYRIHGKQGLPFFQLMRSMGMDAPVGRNNGEQYEEDWIHQTIHLGTNMTATGNPNEYSFTLSNTAPNIDYLEQNVTAPYSTAEQYRFPIMAQQIIKLPNGNSDLMVKNVSISGNTCTVTALHTNPTSAPFVLAQMIAGTELVIYTNAYSEGSDQENGYVPKPLKDYWRTQIIKTTFKVTGSEMVTQIWFNTYSDNTGAITGYRVVGQNNTEYEHALAIDGALLFGTTQEIVNVDSTTLEPNYTTEGVDSYIKRKGQNIPYVPGTVNIPLFDYLGKLLDREGAPEWMGGFLGFDLDTEFTNVLKDYLQNNKMDYVRNDATRDVFGNNPGIAASVNFRAFNKGYRNWLFTQMPQFNMKKLWGASGYKTPGLGWFWPLASKPDVKDPSNRIPYVGTVYRAMGDYSRRAEVFHINGAGPGMKVVSKDLNKLNMRSDIGARHCGGNNMVRLYVP